MKKIPLILFIFVSIFMPSGTALAELNPKTKEIITAYQALVNRAPSGVGGKDMEAAEDLLKKAKEAEKEATDLGNTQLQRVQGMTNFMMALENAKVGNRGWKFGFAKRMGFSSKDATDLQKALKKDEPTVSPIWDLVKSDFSGIKNRYTEILKKKGGDLKEKLDKLSDLINKMDS
jgi:hypothetical protein